VTRRRQIRQRLDSLGEIQEIMGAMRNLAFLETRKLARAVPEQQRVVDTITAALRDLLVSFPDLQGTGKAADEILIVLGSERGFCGDFNRALMTALHARRNETDVPLIAVGRRLSNRLPPALEPLATLQGATTAEEVPGVLIRLMRSLREWRGNNRGRRPIRPVVLHQRRGAGVASTTLDPAGVVDPPIATEGFPPRTNLSPVSLLEKLTEHYLYAVLYQIFYGSLMAENERRMRHMETAVQRIDERIAELRRKGNALRQEEIVEEIEIISLTTGMADS
jgi:F-type H+-transporting ATPase subunit gamma